MVYKAILSRKNTQLFFHLGNSVSDCSYDDIYCNNTYYNICILHLCAYMCYLPTREYGLVYEIDEAITWYSLHPGQRLI